MKKLPFLSGLSIVLLTTVTTVTNIKSALALDFNFNFGTTSGTITGLLDNTNGQGGTVTVLSSANGPIGAYGWNNLSNGFSVSGGDIVNTITPPVTLPGTVWTGVGPGSTNLSFSVVAPNTAFASINGVSPAVVTFTPIPTSTPVSNIPFEFSTTPGLIVLGGISGIAHLCRKRKKKNDCEEKQEETTNKL